MRQAKKVIHSVRRFTNKFKPASDLSTATVNTKWNVQNSEGKLRKPSSTTAINNPQECKKT